MQMELELSYGGDNGKKSRKINKMYSRNLNSIFEYNRDDCIATLMIAKWLIDH